MALQINPNLGTSNANNNSNSKSDNKDIGTPDQDAASQLAKLLNNPSGDAETPTAASPFGSPFKAAQDKDKTNGEAGSSPFATQAKSDSPTSNSLNQNTAGQANSLQQGAALPQSSGGESGANSAASQNLNAKASNTSMSAGQSSSGTQGSGSVTGAGNMSPLSASATTTDSMSANTLNAHTPGVNPPPLEVSAAIKEAVKPKTESLSDSQLAAAAAQQAAAGGQSLGGVTNAGSVEEITQPHVDGEKIEAMMKSVTKELGMRDLSQLKLGGEMTLKLDQSAMPNTELKVRFEGNEMVISVDSQTADVNSFCTDNLALLQQSVSAGMKDDMKVRVEVRNPPPDQPKDGQGGQGGQGGGQGSQQQSQSHEGDSLAN
jgi:hypothetical protein